MCGSMKSSPKVAKELQLKQLLSIIEWAKSVDAEACDGHAATDGN